MPFFSLKLFSSPHFLQDDANKKRFIIRISAVAKMWVLEPGSWKRSLAPLLISGVALGNTFNLANRMEI